MTERMAALRVVFFGFGILSVVLLLVPLGAVLLQSLSGDIKGYSGGALGFEAYHRMLGDMSIIEALKESSYVAMLVTGIAFVLGIPVAVSTHLLSARSRRVVAVVLFMLLATPELVGALTMSYSWSFLGSPHGALSIALALAFIGTPIVALLIMGRLAEADISAMFVSAVTLGASRWSAVIIVGRAVMLPTLSIAVTFVFVISIQDFMYGFFTSRGGTQTFGVLLYTSLRFGIDNALYSMASILAICAAVVAFFASMYFGSKSNE